MEHCSRCHGFLKQIPSHPFNPRHGLENYIEVFGWFSILSNTTSRPPEFKCKFGSISLRVDILIPRVYDMVSINLLPMDFKLSLHNVLFGQSEFLATEQAYLKICVLVIGSWSPN